MSDVPQDLISAADREPAVDRRKQDGGRRRGDRRNRAKSQVGIEISPSGISLAIVQEGANGVSKLITDRIEFDPTSGPYNGDWSTGELGKALSTLTDKYRLAGQAVSIGLGGQPCVTRTWCGDNDEVDANVNEIKGRAHRYLSLGRGEKICCCAEKPIDAKRKRAWVTVANREVVECITSAVETANLRLFRMEHSLSAICQAIGHAEHDAQQAVLIVITDVGGRAELGLSYRGQLLLDYRPTLVESDLNEPYPWAEAVRKHIKCLRRFVQKELPRGESDLEKMCLPGAEQVSAALAHKLKSEHELTSFAFSVSEITDQFETQEPAPETAEMLAAIWLARGNEPTESVVVAADLMQSLTTMKRVSTWGMVKMLWPLAACILLTVGLYVMAGQHGTELSAAEERLESLQPTRMEFAALTMRLEQNKEASKNIEALKAKIPTVHWNEILKSAGRALPQGTWLKSLTIEEQSQIVISGASFTDDAIFDYLGKLSDSTLFEHVTIRATRSIRLRSGPAFEFEISATSTQLNPSEQSESLALK